MGDLKKVWWHLFKHDEKTGGICPQSMMRKQVAFVHGSLKMNMV
jgi:hypothetical protein